MLNNNLILTRSVLIFIFSLFQYQYSFGLAAPVSNDLCIASGYTVGFFNGVWNTKQQADDGRDALRILRGETFNDEPIQYETFYNSTGSSVGATALQDLAETFIQRSVEIDNSGELGKRWEFFWENFSGPRILTQSIIDTFPSALSLFEQLYTAISSRILGAFANLFSNPPTEANYAEHNTRLDALTTQKQKLMLVAHSQGNLFVSHAYDFLNQKLGAESVAVYHIAPASLNRKGDYALADIDAIINALRIQGINSVLPTNVFIPFSRADASGHTLVGTYLDESRSSRSRVSTGISEAMQGLKSPLISGNGGSFTVTLSWDGIGDVDLHTFEPNGSHSYYENRIGIVGALDKDNTVEKGPEHYFASCDANVLQEGTYRVGINNFSSASGRTATVQVASSKGGTFFNKSLGVGPELGATGNANPMHVVDIVVSKDSSTGVFSFSAN